MATDIDILALVGGDAAWLARVKRALGWNEKLGTDATADQVVARLYNALDKIRTFEEERHGIDPVTGADTSAKLLGLIESERIAKEAALAELAQTQAWTTALSITPDGSFFPSTPGGEEITTAEEVVQVLRTYAATTTEAVSVAVSTPLPEA